MKEYGLTQENIGTVHFVGIGGVGMSGIAEVLLNLNCSVQGSDIKNSPTLERLQTFGAQVFIGHRAENVESCDVVVVSSAIHASNPEVQNARALHIPIIKRAEMLAELMRFRYGIAVAGTHGKTTTTSLVAAVLSKAHLDPTFIIGGKVNSWESNARLGDSRYLVAEADESDSSFLHLQPMLAVVTNVDKDHLEAFNHSFENLKQSFVDFIHNLPFYGTAIVCNEDQILRSLFPRMERRLLTYGFREDSMVKASNVTFDGLRSSFDLKLPNDQEALPVTLNLPGQHNILNALGACGVAFLLGVPQRTICEALIEFEGISRRFQHYGELDAPAGKVSLIDDYAHHPQEIDAVLSTIDASWPGRRKVLVFQPHRFSRTQSLFDQFCEVLSQVDDLILLDIYPANEAPITGIDSENLCRIIRQQSQCSAVYAHQEDVPRLLETTLHDGDILVTMGAGSIANLALDIKNYFQPKQQYIGIVE